MTLNIKYLLIVSNCLPFRLLVLSMQLLLSLLFHLIPWFIVSFLIKGKCWQQCWLDSFWDLLIRRKGDIIFAWNKWKNWHFIFPSVWIYELCCCCWHFIVGWFYGDSIEVDPSSRCCLNIDCITFHLIVSKWGLSNVAVLGIYWILFLFDKISEMLQIINQFWVNPTIIPQIGTVTQTS